MIRLGHTAVQYLGLSMAAIQQKLQNEYGKIMSHSIPKYIQTRKAGLLKEKTAKAFKRLSPCCLCPRQCGVDRPAGETGICKTGKLAQVSSFAPHFGEESPLVGSHGSGTLFFTHCNLMCSFCQNFDISHGNAGREMEPEELAEIMLNLQGMGCHNINFVTATHVTPQIMEAVDIAAENGLVIPLVYNSSGYDSVETLKLLNGVMDIYLPDFKFWESGPARISCNAPDYPDIAKKALVEMQAQVGDLKTDAFGVATTGLIVRHLVLADNLAGTNRVMAFIKEKISPDCSVNIMSQYRPCGTARETAGFSRSITASEFRVAVKAAKDHHLKLL